MSLHDRVMDESVLKRALAVAMDTPERFGGPPEKQKKPRQSLAARFKGAAKKFAQAAFPREDVTISHTLAALHEARLIEVDLG